MKDPETELKLINASHDTDYLAYMFGYGAIQGTAAGTATCAATSAAAGAAAGAAACATAGKAVAASKQLQAQQ